MCSITADSAAVDKVIAELSGKDINELIAAGSTKLASVPSGGSSSAAPAAATGSAPAAEAEKKEEKVEEKEESEYVDSPTPRAAKSADPTRLFFLHHSDDMGFGLFD